MKWAGLFILYHVYMISCSSIPMEDLEGFIRFINKTSRRGYHDKSLSRTGSNFSEVSGWEEGEKFQGDMILNDRQRKLIIDSAAGGLSRNGVRDLSKRWPNATVVYSIRFIDFSAAQRNELKQAMLDISRVSCIRFRKKRMFMDNEYVRITGRFRYCQSEVGYQGRKQRMNIPNVCRVNEGCFRRGVLIHELLHVLGFIHMHCNFNRDDYVTVLWENIIKGNEYNFLKFSPRLITDYDLAYDYDSIMHYGRRYFSIDKDRLDTLVPHDEEEVIGQRVRLSEIDIKKLNKMYCSTNEKKEKVLKSLLSGG